MANEKIKERLFEEDASKDNVTLAKVVKLALAKESSLKEATVLAEGTRDAVHVKEEELHFNRAQAGSSGQRGWSVPPESQQGTRGGITHGFSSNSRRTQTIRQQQVQSRHPRICSSISLKGMHLNVPRAVRAGHSVTLGCEYDLEGALLYSVKWYRDYDEFYRYVPKEEPPIRVFPLQDVRVDVSVSNSHNVTLLSVGRDISGLYQCEVSADAPLFHTDVKSAPMTVSVVPVGVPLVTVNKTGLEHGRPLIADCHAPPSHPAANITFFVNDEKVPGFTSEFTVATEDQLEQKTARLELTGVGGSWEALRIRCEASLFRLYRANSLQVEVKPDTPQPASVLLLGPSSNGVPTAIVLDHFSTLQRWFALVMFILLVNWLHET